MTYSQRRIYHQWRSLFLPAYHSKAMAYANEPPKHDSDLIETPKNMEVVIHMDSVPILSVACLFALERVIGKRCAKLYDLCRISWDYQWAKHNPATGVDRIGLEPRWVLK